MSTVLVIVGILVVIVVAAAISAYPERKRLKALLPEERKREIELYCANLLHGPINLMMICPHCQEKGHVRQKAVTHKKGISGGKAVGALFTFGVSMLATGLSRKEGATEAYCGNCKSTWNF